MRNIVEKSIASALKGWNDPKLEETFLPSNPIHPHV